METDEVQIEIWVKRWRLKEKEQLLHDIEERTRLLQRQILNLRICGKFRDIRKAEQLIGFLRNFETEVRRGF